MHEFRAMNTNFFTAGLSAGLQTRAEAWIRNAERTFSRFRPDSELSALNRSGGSPFLASPLLYQAIAEADHYRGRTNGLFNPYLGETIRRLGYDRSFELLGAPCAAEERRNEDAERAKSVSVPEIGRTAEPVLLDDGMRSIALAPGASADLGGFAKGWSAHRLGAMLRKEGIRTLAIGAGGDLSLWGMPKGGWTIGIADPLREGEGADILSLRLQGSMGVATSSRAKRRWTDASGELRHHLIDPRTGVSTDSDLLQVTVLAPDLVQAEVCAKCVLILGSEAGGRWLEEHFRACAAIGVCEEGVLWHAGDSAAYEWKGDEPHERIS